ncbi:MAG: hypothetical protein PSV35_02340, partial [bacterium]|nr:hypothetical protein [bacterium]
MPVNKDIIGEKRPILTRELSDLIELIALWINEIIENNITAEQVKLAPADRAPLFSISDYLKRCTNYLEFSEIHYIHMMSYLKRSNEARVLHPLTIHKLLYIFLHIGHKRIDEHMF